jgi:hypothetical protein
VGASELGADVGTEVSGVAAAGACAFAGCETAIARSNAPSEGTQRESGIVISGVRVGFRPLAW